MLEYPEDDSEGERVFSVDSTQSQEFMDSNILWESDVWKVDLAIIGVGFWKMLKIAICRQLIEKIVIFANKEMLVSIENISLNQLM